MTDNYEILGIRKRGDDWTFRGITVRDSLGALIDLSAEGWTVACSISPRIDLDSSTKVPLVIDQDELVNSRVVLSLPKATSSGLEPRTWFGDLQVDGPEGRHSSDTFIIIVRRDVTENA